MDNLPDPTFKPNDADQVIKLYGKPLAPERKRALMEKLVQQKERFVQQEDKTNDQEQDRGGRDC